MGEVKTLSQVLMEHGWDREHVYMAQMMESKLRLVKSVVDGYLEFGRGGGGRAICLRIKQIVESK